ncbi:MAG: aconitate hydratase, partial [Clostridia bacterium]|nr:aconitate hydratase [Clostridia bacterium]
NMIAAPVPAEDMDSVEVLRGPNIKPFPVSQPLADTINAGVSLKVGDNITTDHIMPAGAKILPLRSNIPKISEYCFAVCDEKFHDRALEMGKSIIIGGSNYGQGSSREHAALAPLYLGVKAVITKSFARIHMANLVNAGIIPMTFANENDYDKIDQNDELKIENVKEQLSSGNTVKVTNITKGFDFEVNVEVSARQKEMLYAGGLLNYTKQNA